MPRKKHEASGGSKRCCGDLYVGAVVRWQLTTARALGLRVSYSMNGCRDAVEASRLSVELYFGVSFKTEKPTMRPLALQPSENFPDAYTSSKAIQPYTVKPLNSVHKYKYVEHPKLHLP